MLVAVGSLTAVVLHTLHLATLDSIVEMLKVERILRFSRDSNHFIVLAGESRAVGAVELVAVGVEKSEGDTRC